MRGDGRIFTRGQVFYIAYSIGGRSFRESTGSRNWAEQLGKERLASLLVPAHQVSP